MKKLIYGMLFLLPFCSGAQELPQKINTAITNLSKDDQFKHAIIGMYVVDAKDGKIIFEKNSETGLVPASCQKIITSASAFELLGQTFRYETELKLRSQGDDRFLEIFGAGDPSMGSWRWPQTKPAEVFSIIHAWLRKLGTIGLAGIYFHDDGFADQPVPRGWVWEDIGNYYGTGAWNFNWGENKYDLILASGNKEYDSTTVVAFDPPEAIMPLDNFIVTGKPGSNDNAYIFSSPNSSGSFATGSIPPGQKRFIISGSMNNPSNVFLEQLKQYLSQNKIPMVEPVSGFKKGGIAAGQLFIKSPGLDSINYWFLKKSINLYGEALVKTIAETKYYPVEADTGIDVIRNLWQQKGIEKSSLKIIDGSGLSPANRVTPKALVQVLQYAKKQNWFASFYNALPEMNGIKMKDGYIGGVRSYTGYIKSKSGNEYVFSFIVNNFDGNPASVREKMWKVLDLLK